MARFSADDLGSNPDQQSPQNVGTGDDPFDLVRPDQNDIAIDDMVVRLVRRRFQPLDGIAQPGFRVCNGNGPVAKNIGIEVKSASAPGFEIFLAQAVFFHEFMQLAGCYPCFFSRLVYAPFVPGKHFFQVAPLDFLDAFGPDLGKRMR